MTSSIQPEVHNVSQRRQRTEPLAHRKSGVVLTSFLAENANGQTNKHTNRHAYSNTSQPYRDEVTVVICTGTWSTEPTVKSLIAGFGTIAV